MDDLPPKPKKVLESPELQLFSAGACHVFAEQLIQLLPDCDYRLRCLEVENWSVQPLQGERRFNSRRLVHVFVASEDWMIDVSGCRPESEYLDEYRQKHRKIHGISTHFDKTFPRDCFLSELFVETMSETDTGPMSKDRLYLHPDFLVNARNRAIKFIALNLNKYDIRTKGREIHSASVIVENPVVETASARHQ